MTLLRLSLVAACAALFASCTSSVDMPKGNSKGYNSARLVKRAPDAAPISDAKERSVHNQIQNSIAAQFKARGMGYNTPDADLVVAYMVIYQENAMTTSFDDFFGHGRENDKILKTAHKKGVEKETRPDYFQRAGLLVDVIDAKTNKLVFRNVAVGDVVKGSASTRSQRINNAVNQALAPFFK